MGFDQVLNENEARKLLFFFQQFAWGSPVLLTIYMELSIHFYLVILFVTELKTIIIAIEKRHILFGYIMFNRNPKNPK